MKLKASICQCGKISIPPRSRCPLCGKRMSGTEVDNRGKLLTYTVVHVVPEGFESPRSVGLVELESGARVLCEIEDGYPIDSKVEVVPEGDLLRAKM